MRELLGSSGMAWPQKDIMISGFIDTGYNDRLWSGGMFASDGIPRSQLVVLRRTT
jgi:hypothetical protein